MRDIGNLEYAGGGISHSRHGRRVTKVFWTWKLDPFFDSWPSSELGLWASGPLTPTWDDSQTSLARTRPFRPHFRLRFIGLDLVGPTSRANGGEVIPSSGFYTVQHWLEAMLAGDLPIRQQALPGRCSRPGLACNRDQGERLPLTIPQSSSRPAKMVDSGAHTLAACSPAAPSRHQDETGRPERRVD